MFGPRKMRPIFLSLGKVFTNEILSCQRMMYVKGKWRKCKMKRKRNMMDFIFKIQTKQQRFKERLN